MDPKHQDIFEFEGEDFQILAQEHSSKPEDKYFDQVVAALQQIVVDDQFQQIQSKFMSNYCHVFEDVQENKLEYTKIFELYNQQIEVHIQKVLFECIQSLTELVPDFTMASFLAILSTRPHDIDEQILDMLQSFTDFQIFKRLILDYKAYYAHDSQNNSQRVTPEMIITVHPLQRK